jgi:hypothetical protein
MKVNYLKKQNFITIIIFIFLLICAFSFYKWNKKTTLSCNFIGGESETDGVWKKNSLSKDFKIKIALYEFRKKFIVENKDYINNFFNNHGYENDYSNLFIDDDTDNDNDDDDEDSSIFLFQKSKNGKYFNEYQFNVIDSLLHHRWSFDKDHGYNDFKCSKID